MRSSIDGVRHRWRSIRLAEGMGALAAATGTVVVALFALDNVVHLAATSRVALLVVAVALLAALAVRGLLLRPLRPLGDEECALLVERSGAGLEDRLINTICFRRRPPKTTVERAVMDIVEEEAATIVASVPARRILDARRAMRIAALAGGAATMVCLYAAILPAHFRNAATRFARPLADVPPLTRTRIRVSPGDVDLRCGDALAVTAETEGLLPEKATIRLSSGASMLMRFDGRRFGQRVEAVVADLSYRVEAGDASSPEYRVRVVRPPEVKALDVTVQPPAYTGLPAREERGSTGNVEALVGSRVILDVLSTHPLEAARILARQGGSLEMDRLAPERFRASVDLFADLDYELFLLDAAGTASSTTEPRRKLRAVPDAPPRCEVIEPGEDVSLPRGAESLPVRVRVADDVGLSDVVLLAATQDATGSEGSSDAPGRSADAPTWKVVEEWKRIRGEGEAVVAAVLDVGRMAHGSGGLPAAVLCRAVARDLKGSETSSRTLRVRLLSSEGSRERSRQVLERLRTGVAEVLKREEDLERRTSALREAGAPVRPDLQSLAREQYDIRSLLAAVLARSGNEVAGALRGLARLASDLMPEVALRLLSAASPGQPAADLVESAIEGERQVIEILRRAIGGIDARIRGDAVESPSELARPMQLRTAGGRLRDLLGKLREYSREAGEVLARTRALEGKRPEDFTEPESKALEELAGVEERWGRLLDDKGADLSKVAPQDMSVGSLVEEVVELVEEIDLARDYLKGKNIELAVPVEQSGVAMSAELETNIERWLLRDRDRLKWVMEEPTGSFDVPLADLPSEIEDIVGDLVDREDLMTEETKDVTSSWLDSMDDGVGWDAMDGPISNMSAKGVTGNLQPNDMEIGGRSGEGRSGRSQGQFVEETASGKGGRQTPTRSTSDPFESGEVRDAGRDPTGGGTGGGKLAGAGPAGLRGAPSPELDRKMGALAGRQTEIRQAAEKLDVALRKRRFYSQSLDRALTLMRALEEKLAAREPSDYESARKLIVSELRDLGRVTAQETEPRLEEGPGLPSALAEDLRNASGEEAPAEFGDLIRDYYGLLGSGPAVREGSATKEAR